MTREAGRLSMPGALPAGATDNGDGIVVGQGAATVEAYIDYQCPFCRQFELSSGPALAQLVSNGEVSLVYHPMNFLDEVSPTQYSTRAAAAAGCASDAGRFLEYTHALFVNQPPEGSIGLSDEELIELGLAVGIRESAFAEGVRSGAYRDWPPYVTQLAVARGVAGTPSVFVEGVPVPARAGSIVAAVNSLKVNAT